MKKVIGLLILLITLSCAGISVFAAPEDVPDYIRVGMEPSLSVDDVKQYMAKHIAQQIIKDNILQIKNFDSYYEGSVDFVKSETNFWEK